MNPVFMAKLPSTSADNNGRLFELASAPSVDAAAVPGALPRTPNRGAVTLAKLQSQRPNEPAVVASVPMPHPAPQPKQGEVPAEQEKPASIAGLIGNLFSGSKSDPAPAPPPQTEKEQVATRSTARSTGFAAKPKPAAPAHTASAPVRTASAGSSPWPTEPAPWPAPASKTPAEAAAPAPKPAAVQQAAKAEPPRPEIRTAYTTPPASNNGLLSGAQPVVPVGTFNSFR
jgi:hypothetical protein